MDTVSLFQITIHNVTMAEAVAAIGRLARGTVSSYVVTPNVDHVVKLQSDPRFQEVYRGASLVLADGMPVVWASRLALQPLKERVTGADLFLEVCSLAASQGLKVFLLGSASEQIIGQTRQTLVTRFPGLNIVGAVSPSFGFDQKPEETRTLVEGIRAAKPDILFVGVGAPKQEKWIFQNREALGVPVSLGVGAAFDFVAGSIKRAPLWMQKTGLEWFYRFLKEPKRMFRRYFIDDFVFLRLAATEILQSRKGR